MTLTLQSTIVANGENTSASMNDDLVVLSLDQGLYFGLNTTGAFIWERIQEPISVAAVYDAVQEVYDVGREDCEKLTLNLLKDLHEHNLLYIISDA